MQVVVGIGKGRGRPPADYRQFRPRFFERHPRRKTADDTDLRPISSVVVQRAQAERDPGFVKSREFEPLGHDADDRAFHVPEADASSDDAGVASEPCLPRAMADDDHRRRAWLFVIIRQQAADYRSHSREPQRRRADLGDNDRLGNVRARDQIALERSVGAEIRDRPELLAPDCEIVQSLIGRAVRRGVPQPDLDDAIALVEGECRPGHLRREFERGRSRRDCEGHRETADERQARILDEHPRAKLEVHRPACQPSERARVAVVLFRLLDAAEGAPGRVPGVVGAHAPCDESVLEQKEVRLDFARELGLGAAGPDQSDQTLKEAADRGHA